MRNSTYIRLFIAMSLIVFISLALLGGLSIMLNYRRTITERKDMMTSALHETARYVTTQHLSYGLPLYDLDMSMPLTAISRITGFDILVANTQGVVVACSELAMSSLGTTIADDVLHQINTGRDTAVFMSTLGKMYPALRHVAGMQMATSIGGEMRPYAYLFVTSDMAVPNREWRSFTTAFILLAVSVMSLAVVIAFIASKKQAEPLNEMAVVARRFARGEYDIRVDEIPGRNDEIGQLIRAFNYMADAMQSNEEIRRDFIANISHELKTPMTVIAGFAEGLLDGTIAREDEDRYLQIISSETRRLSRLVKSMMEISVLGETPMQSMLESSFDITEVVRLSLLGLSGKIDAKKLNVEADLPEDALMTRGSKDSITQVVYNLIDNAIKYSYTGSTISLEVWQQESRVFVSISNHGETIPAPELPHLFERFHKIDKSRSVDREGVGLGLYIVKAILDKHNEDIFVTSADGMTKFIFSLTSVNVN